MPRAVVSRRGGTPPEPRRASGPGYEVRYPLLPNEDDPDAAVWQVAIAGELAALDEGAIRVGYSIGATLLAAAVADRAPAAARFGALILIAACQVAAVVRTIGGRRDG